ncbi:MAG: PAS domain S-box protein [Dehalococcoidia bacterium]|nr:PAS domain S-box protein [Dehalococcoidia bacterium]
MVELKTLRKRVSDLEARERLHKRAGALLHIFRINSPVGLFVVQDGKFVFANEQFQNLLGVNAEKLTGSNSLDLVYPADRETVREKAIKMLKGELTTPYIYRVVGKDRQIRWVHEGVVSVQYEGRRATLGHSLDITDRVRAEAKLRRLYESEKNLRKKLENEVNKRIEFTRALVHELKTPLTPILFSSELLVDELSEQPWQSVARNIHRGASNLNNRIDELLDLARVEIGGLKLHPQMVDPNRLISNIAGDMGSLPRNELLGL